MLQSFLFVSEGKRLQSPFFLLNCRFRGLLSTRISAVPRGVHFSASLSPSLDRDRLDQATALLAIPVPGFHLKGKTFSDASIFGFH